MNFRITIGRKIGFGFGILIFLTLLAFFLTFNTANSSKEINDEITNVVNPSVDALEELNLLLVQSKMLISKWVYFASSDDMDFKARHRQLVFKDYPNLKEKLHKLSENWQSNEQEKLKEIFGWLDLLFKEHKKIMNELNSIEIYEDPLIVLMARESVDEGDLNEKNNKVMELLSDLIADQQNLAKESTKRMNSSFSELQLIVRLLGIALTIGGILIAFFTVRSIVRPVSQLKRLLLQMGRGIVPTEKIKPRNDEIGEMSLALNHLISAVERQTEFAKGLGAGNFSQEYQPLSQQDTLGQALLKMRDDLYENERFLEQKVEERTAEVVRQKEEIESQRVKLEHLYNEVTDSIKYAKRIQEAILPPDALVKKELPNPFVLYKPKDIVSGDFYWMEKVDNKVFFAAVDCTGHGVPGAFMSIVGYNLLKQIVKEESDPGKILNMLSRGVKDTLHQGVEEGTSKDGMDIALCSYDAKTKVLQYAGAYNPLYLIRGGELIETKADKFPIGGALEDSDSRSYTSHSVQLQSDDTVYIFSDGYADQFGGEKGKKFMVKQFRQLLLGIQEKSMEEQKRYLNYIIEQWRGNHEQVDDILIMGMRV
jgi:serine phosphatase RsbU (regulator of sigma subunit)/HAMP domain-containing protein